MCCIIRIFILHLTEESRHSGKLYTLYVHRFSAIVLSERVKIHNHDSTLYQCFLHKVTWAENSIGFANPLPFSQFRGMRADCGESKRAQIMSKDQNLQVKSLLQNLTMTE